MNKSVVGAGPVAEGELIRQSIVEIRKLKKQVSDLQNGVNEPIAVIGVGCEFPGGASGASGFWDLLRDGRDATSSAPEARHRLTDRGDARADVESNRHVHRGGYLQRDLSLFDSLFFGIPPKEANFMDPQHRLFLEVVWQAIANAGISTEELAGSRTGVFCGITGGDYLQQVMRETRPDEYGMYLTSGNCGNFCAGRVSYLLDLRGPSLALDTACSSSLVAVHAGCESLRRNECDLAIVGGVSLMLEPDITEALAAGNMLAQDGRCKTFDAAADGYARGEGCGVVLLKRSGDAIADRDNVLAVLSGSEVQHDGKKSGLTVPTSVAQRRLLRSTLERAKRGPHEVVYVEAHGTGTPLGDPIELEALQAAYARGRTPDRPLYVGSVKTNVGHLEAAAGIAGLIKVVLAMGQNELPPHLNLERPNEHFDWNQSNIEVVEKLRSWPLDRRKIAAVSSFGASGTNAHVLVEESPTEFTPAVSVAMRLPDYDRTFVWYKTTAANAPPESSAARLRHESDTQGRSSVPVESGAFFENALLHSVHELTLSVDSVPTIRQHRIFDRIVLTGSIYLELAQRVVRDLCGVSSCIDLKFGNVVLMKPIVFPSPDVELKLSVEKTVVDVDDSRYRVRLFPGDCDDLAVDAMHSSIDVEVIGDRRVRWQPSTIDLQEMIDRCPQELSREEFYGSFWGDVFDIGEHFRLCDVVWRQDGRLAVGESQPRKFFLENDAHGIDRDSFTAYLLGLVFKGALPESTIRHHADIGIAFIGTGYESCTFFETLDTERLYVIAEITDAQDENTRFVGSATIVDETGRVRCEMKHIEFCTVRPQSIPGAGSRDYAEPPTAVSARGAGGSGSDHPILGPMSSRLTTLSRLNLLSYDTYPLIGDHTTFDYALFPALGYMHLAISSLARTFGGFEFTAVRDLIVHQPILLTRGESYPTQTRVKRRPEGDFDYEILCYSEKRGVLNQEWVLSSSATVSDRPLEKPASAAFDKTSVSEYEQRYSTEEFFRHFWGEEFVLGPSYHHMNGVWRRPFGGVGLIGSFGDTEHLIGIPDMPANFLQIYMSLPLAMAAVPDEYIHRVRTSNSTCIAATVESFLVYDNNGGRCYEELWSVAELRDKQDIENRWETDFSYYDQSGTLVAEVRGVVFQIMKKEAVVLLRESLESRRHSAEDISAITASAEDCEAVLERALNSVSGLSPSQLGSGINLGEVLDSIMALQLKSIVEDELSVMLPLSVVSRDGSFDDLLREIVSRSGCDRPGG